MNSKVTIIMYHYVRDLKHNRYPDIKGLDVKLFKEQIVFLRKNYNIITMDYPVFSQVLFQHFLENHYIVLVCVV